MTGWLAGPGAILRKHPRQKSNSVCRSTGARRAVIWVTAVLVALRRLGEQTGILAASGEFLGSFNCSEFELTSQKVFGKLCFNILCPDQWDVALVLSSLNSVGPTLAHSSGGFGLVVQGLILFGFHSSMLLIDGT